MLPTPGPSAIARTRRALHRARLIALLIILFGPIAQGAWAVRENRRIEVDSREVAALAYVSARNPAIDAFMPDGRGGTHYFETLGPKADGLAFPDAAAIAISASRDLGPWPEAVELHERAHLVDAFLPTEVARLMARLPAPATGEYAATNAGEHFGEMAAKAWEIVSPPGNVCVDGTPAQRLEQAESRVPGTAGFVLRYLSLLPRTGESTDDDELRATAVRLSASVDEEWAAIWRGVDVRHRPDGTFEPWPSPTVRAYLEARLAEARSSHRLVDRFLSVALLPSVTIVRLAGV